VAIGGQFLRELSQLPVIPGLCHELDSPGLSTILINSPILLAGILSRESGVSPEAVDTIDITAELSHNRNLQLACQRVEAAWFPVNPALLDKITSGLAEGRYDLDVEFLISELKSDFALFTWTLKELSKMVREQKVPIPVRASPMAMFQAAGLQTLKLILNTAPKALLEHSFEQMNDLQMKRLQEAIISATTAEMLSKTKKIDQDISYSTGLLRQLGLALIAWNYPTVYRRALLSLQAGTSLELALTRALGFSPSLLGIVMAQRWGLAPELRYALGDSNVRREASEKHIESLEQSGEMLAKLCEIGEALARANNPEHYPSAARDWDESRQFIEQSLGHEGIRLIRQRIKEYYDQYVNSFPDIFRDRLDIQPERKITVKQDEHCISRNRHVKECPLALRQEFQTLYAFLMPGMVSREGVGMLAQQIIPKSGFYRGCVYIVEPSTQMLVPRLKTGDVALSQYQAISCNPGASATNPLIAAFRCSTPIVENGTFTGDDGPSFIASVIGNNQRAGVLYLEMDTKLAHDLDSRPLSIFKAILQAFNDCLNLA
jgi:hypothetical protein